MRSKMLFVFPSFLLPIDSPSESTDTKKSLLAKLKFRNLSFTYMFFNIAMVTEWMLKPGCLKDPIPSPATQHLMLYGR